MSYIYIEFVVINCWHILDSNFNVFGWERDNSFFRFLSMVVTSGDYNFNEKVGRVFINC
jgi:hypothetical protein